MMSVRLLLAQRILLTLAYTEQFNFPLRACELYTRLLVGFPVSYTDFLDAIVLLNQKKLLKYADGHFFIKGLSETQVSKLITVRKQRQNIAKQKWQEVALFVTFAQKIPFITGVSVTGSLAVENTVSDDDIDFMIVTAQNRLWLTRILVLLYASLHSKRRSFAKEEKNSWCFNLWVEESDLQLPVGSRSVYEAYEVMQAKWVFSRQTVAQTFVVVNDWTKKLLFNAKSNQDFLTRSKVLWSDFFIISWFLFIANYLLFYLQYWYMKPHMTREKVSLTHAFFHPRNTKQLLFDNWKETLARLSR